MKNFYSKSKIRKLVASLLCAVMLLGVLPLNGIAEIDFKGLHLPEINHPDFSSLFLTKVSAETSGTCGENLTWTLDDEGTLTISGTGEMENYNVYGSPWNSCRESIKSIVISNGVTSIGDYAFEDCIGLTSVTIGNSVTSIGVSAFYNCTGLTSVTIPDSVINIGRQAFSECNQLINVKIGKGVSVIENGSFSGCKCIKSITIPEGVESIEADAFSGCTGLTEITIPAGVTSIGDLAFTGCTGLTSITVAPGNTVYHSEGNCLIETGSKTLIAGCKNSVIPDDGSVTIIGGSAFFNCSGLTSVTIPASVTSIGDSAFRYCSGLISIIIGNSVISIGDNAFEGCTGFTNVTIPDGVTSIEKSTFAQCTELTEITIPDSVTSIDGSAFSGCTGLTSITVDSGNTVYHSKGNCLIETDSKTLVFGCKNSNIPDDGSVTIIGNEAFFGCSGLASITIPDSVTSIGFEAFIFCSGLTSVILGNGVISIGEGAFYECTGLTSIIFPDSVTSIGDGALARCYQLQSITVSKSVAKIGKGVFDECYSLEGISVDKDNHAYISVGNCLIETASKTLLAGCKSSVIPDDSSVTIIGDGAFSGRNLTDIDIPDGVTVIGDRAFAHNSQLYVSIPESVNYIGVDAFDGTASLNDEKNWDNGVLYIDNCLIKAEKNLSGSYKIKDGTRVVAGASFQGCDYLTGISCPESVISIGDYAFDCCYGLTSVTNPDSVTSIGKEAFRSCFNLKNITIGKSVTSIGDYAFWNCESIKVIDIPDSVTSIGDGAFKDCTSLTTVIIGNGVTSIGEETFFYCDRLTSITIGNGVKSIGDWAFYDCTELTEITIPKSVTCIGDIAFGRCTGLTSVTIPDSVTSIGDQAFYWCIGLTSVNIPNGVTDIGDYAFFNCGSLIDIVIPDSVESIGEYAFSDCYSLSSVKIPDSVEYIGEHAFEGVMNIIYNAEKMTAAGSPWGARNVDAYHEDNLWYYDKTKKVLTGCDVTAGNLVEVPGSVMEVDSEVFLNCDRVRTVDFKSENIAFCEDAFGGCPNLETVVTKNNTVDGITYSIAPDRQTRKLSSGKLSSDKNVNEEIRIKKDTEISFCNRDREDDYVVPDNIVSIGKNAFSNCTEVTVTIPDSVKLRHIGKDAFKNNKNYRNWNNNDALLINDYVVAAFRGLSSMAFSASVKGIADYVFESFASLCDISFGSGSKLEFIGKGAFSGCESLSTVRLPKNLKILGTGAFENTAITTAAEKPVVNGTTLVYVPENTESFTFKGEYKDITCIADGAFKNCSELKEIIIPETIISIGERTFEGCTSLNKITLPKSLNEIGKFAFKDCINLTSVDIPENVDTIADEENLAFYGCSGLEAINVAPENKYFSSDKGILMNKAGDTIINFPAENMTRDSNNKDYTVPGTIKEIKSFAFRRCKVIGNIYVKNGVGLGNRNPFEGFKGLFGRYDTGVDGIPVSDTLYSDSNETDIAGVSTSVKGTYTVPDQVTSIGANAFVDCKEITEVIFPARLAVIGDEAFKDCSRLKKVTFYAPEDGSRNENMKDIGTDAFKGCPVKECNYEVLNEKLQKIMKIYIEQGADESKIKFSAPSGTITNVKYNQPAKIIASATGLPKGYKLAIYEGDSQKKAVTADDKGEATVELETGAITSDRTFTVKVLDASGNEVDGKSKTVTIDVDDGFFAKIISFFLKLFGALKAVDIKNS